jgi:hypothetical protein
MTIWNIAAALTGERLLMKDTSGGRPSRDEIARLAYRLYEMRGRRDGHDLDDWLAAERQLGRRRSS